MSQGENPRTIGKYEILSILGKGGMGVVYKGRDPMIDRIVAIKTISGAEHANDEQLLARLRMEAKSAGRLHHPNIVTIFDFGHENDISYLVMEYVEGANLARVINSGVELPLDTKLDIITQLCDALSYAHELGVVHRDIKPSNICLTKRGDPKVLDFGLARFDETKLTKTGLTSGTLSYMSPERIRGESGPSDDIFALGAVAYEILTGHEAFPGDTYSAVVSKILSGQYPAPPSKTVPSLPADLDLIIARATATDKKQRYQTAQEFGRALREFRYSETFKRNRAASQAPAASAEEVLNTVAMQSPGFHPYSAPDIDQPTADVAIQSIFPEEAPRAAAPPLQATSPGRTSAPAPVRKQTSTGHDPQEDLRTVAFNQSDYQAPTQLASAPQLKKPAAAAAAPGEEAPASSNSIMAMTRTMVARVFMRRDDKTAVTAARSAAPLEEDTSVKPANSFYGWAGGLAVLLALAPTAVAIRGQVAYLILYVLAIGAWLAVVKGGKRATLGIVLGIAVALRLVVIFQSTPAAAAIQSALQEGAAVVAGENPYVAGARAAEAQPASARGAEKAAPVPAATDASRPVSSTPPYAVMMYSVFAFLGVGVAAWRWIVLLIDLAVVALLWDRLKPRHALAYAAFPLVVLEGVWNGRLEIVAAAALVGAAALLKNQRDGIAAIVSTVAAGLSTVATAGLPILYSAAWKMFWFLFGAGVTVAFPLILFSGASAWTAPFRAFVAASPLLSSLAALVESLFGSWGVAKIINDLMALLAKRLGPGHGFDQVTNQSAATALLIIAAVIGITVAAQRARETSGAVANALGIMLLLGVTQSPWSWIVLVPFAIVANAQLWILVAACSPILSLAASADGHVNWVVYGISLAIPVLILFALRLQALAGEKLHPVFDPSA